MEARVPEEYIHEDDGPELVLENNILQTSPLELAVGLVSTALQPPFSDVDVVLVQNFSVWLVWRAGNDKITKDTDGDSDDGTDYIHPSPSCQTMNAVKTGRCSGLDQSSRQGTQGQATVEETTSASNFSSLVPGSFERRQGQSIETKKFLKLRANVPKR